MARLFAHERRHLRPHSSAILSPWLMRSNDALRRGGCRVHDRMVQSANVECSYPLLKVPYIAAWKEGGVGSYGPSAALGLEFPRGGIGTSPSRLGGRIDQEPSGSPERYRGGRWVVGVDRPPPGPEHVGSRTRATRGFHAPPPPRRDPKAMAKAAVTQSFVRHAVRRTARRGCVRTQAAVAVPSKVRGRRETYTTTR
eukprot:scaffold776_cov347-Pavlova_lutheri.AAC.153